MDVTYQSAQKLLSFSQNTQLKNLPCLYPTHRHHIYFFRNEYQKKKLFKWKNKKNKKISLTSVQSTFRQKKKWLFHWYFTLYFREITCMSLLQSEYLTWVRRSADNSRQPSVCLHPLFRSYRSADIIIVINRPNSTEQKRNTPLYSEEKEIVYSQIICYLSVSVLLII